MKNKHLMFIILIEGKNVVLLVFWRRRFILNFISPTILETDCIFSVFSFLCTHRAFVLFIVYYLYQQMHIYIYNYITNAPTCFAASAPFSGSFDIAFATVINY